MPLTPALAAGGNCHVSMCGEKIGSIYKKKYKVEKAKISENSVASQWPFYFRLDMLFDPSIMFKKPPPSPPLALPLPSHRKGLSLPTADVTVAWSFDPPPPKERHSNATPALLIDESFTKKNYLVVAAVTVAAVDGVSGSSSRSSWSSMERSKSSWKRSLRVGRGVKMLVRAMRSRSLPRQLTGWPRSMRSWRTKSNAR